MTSKETMQVNLKKNKIYKLSNFIFLIFLILVSIYCTYKSIYYGWDIDESYQLTMAYRYLQGDRLFKTMWAVHQSSVVFSLPFMYLFFKFSTTTAGVVVYMRICGTIVQLCASVYGYHVFRKYINRIPALVLVSMFYNFTPKFIQSLEFCFCAYIFFFVLICAFMNFLKTKKSIDLFVAGIAMACCVLSYPTLIILFLYFFFLILFSKKIGEGYISKKNLCYFIGGISFVALFFLILVFKDVTLKEFFRNLPYIYSDRDHSTSIWYKNHKLLGGLWDVCNEILIVAIPLSIIHLIAHHFKKEKIDRIVRTIMCVFVIAGCVFLGLYYYHDVMNAQHLSINWVIFYIVFIICFMLIFYRKHHKIHLLNYYAVFPSIIFVLATSWISDLDIYANFGLLLPGLLVGFIDLHNEIEEDVTTHQKLAKGIEMFLIIFAFTGIILGRIFFVRMTAVQPVTTINTDFYDVGIGPAKDIDVTRMEHIQYHDKAQAILNHVDPDDTILYIGGDTYLYMLAGTKVGAHTCISTPNFDSVILKYYEFYPEKIPDAIIIDTYYYSLEDVLTMPDFGDYVKENYDINAKNIEKSAYTIIIYRK